MTTLGYSGKPLAQKLGIKEGMRLLVENAPQDYSRLVGPLQGVETAARAAKSVDIVHLFVTRRSDLAKKLAVYRKSLRPDATVWISWPKRTSRVLTDITEDTIREVALPLGFVDVKVCAVSDVWSGLKLVVRAELR